jgi:ATPase subunit of ABC transporter with duplicated ATPase domains
MRPDDRIALTGPNGAGKSTLVTYILGHLRIMPEHLTYVPQEIGLEQSIGILNDARRLSREQLGTLMMIVSRLGSRPERLLESDEPSPGEIRKIMLGLGILREPHLIILDEPTNHMDLPSIECLEKALADCPCGLLLVSHDQRFLNALTRRRWHIEGGKKDCYELSESSSFKNSR